MSSSFIRFVARLMIVCLLGMMAPVQASIMPTETTTAASSAEREKVTAFLSRQDVAQQLQQYGVTSEAAAERVAALSDDEVHQLSQKIDSLPAGGDVLGIIFTIFIVLLITDILGFTKVFPFTRSIR